MAAGSYSSKRSWRAMQGRLKKFYIRTQARPDSLWLVAASADTEAQLTAAIERVRTRHPERTIRVERNVGGTLVVVEEATTAAARAA